MSKQLLIYEKAASVSSQRHKDWSVLKSGDYAFASDLNSVPLVAAEFPFAAREYVIVFAGQETVMPIAILGLHGKENLYLKEGGGWEAKYVPAFVRRYPFVFSSDKEAKRFTLCIDEDYAGCNQEGLGERLFDDEGNKTKYLDNMLEFVKRYQAHNQRTQLFCKKLKEMNLLDPMQANITSSKGEKMRLGGFMAISRERLKALPADQLAELAKTDELELVYLHLQSMKNLDTVVARGGAQASGGEAKAPAEEEVVE